MRRKWLPAVVFGVAYFLALAVSRRASRRVAARTGDEQILFAHRGASADFPENTLAAFEAGTSAGATHLEMDVHVSRDGHVVVIHDATVDRTTDGSGSVRDMTLAELRGLDAGRGFRVPTLGEVLRRFPEAGINLEIKGDQAGAEKAVLREIEAAGAEARTLVAAERHAVMRRFRRLAGASVATAASRREIRTFLILSRLRLEGLLHPEYFALQVPPRYRGIEIITPRFIEAARNMGVRVDAWTINEPEEARRLLALGVEGIMSDTPAAVKRALDANRNGKGEA